MRVTGAACLACNLGASTAYAFSIQLTIAEPPMRLATDPLESLLNGNNAPLACPDG